MDRSVKRRLEELLAALRSPRSAPPEPRATDQRAATIPLRDAGSLEGAYTAGVLLGLRLAGALSEAEYDDWERRIARAAADARDGLALFESEPSRVLQVMAPATPHGDMTIRMDRVSLYPSGVKVDWVVDLSDERVQEDLVELARKRENGELSSWGLQAYTLGYSARLGTPVMSDDTGTAYECRRTEPQFAPDWRSLQLATWFTPDVGAGARRLTVVWESAEVSYDLP
jgi:hypothetical protein